jgi:hypothetical protein
MTATTSVSTVQGERGLVGQTVVVIGGSAGIGFETARRARADGAEVILTGRNPERLEHAVHELGSKARGDEVDPHRRELERQVGDERRRRRCERRRDRQAGGRAPGSVPLMNSSVPPGRTLPTASRATRSVSHRCSSTSRCPRAKSNSARGA